MPTNSKEEGILDNLRQYLQEVRETPLKKAQQWV